MFLCHAHVVRAHLGPECVAHEEDEVGVAQARQQPHLVCEAADRVCTVEEKMRSRSSSAICQAMFG